MWIFQRFTADLPTALEMAVKIEALVKPVLLSVANSVPHCSDAQHSMHSQSPKKQIGLVLSFLRTLQIHPDIFPRVPATQGLQ